MISTRSPAIRLTSQSAASVRGASVFSASPLERAKRAQQALVAGGAWPPPRDVVDVAVHTGSFRGPVTERAFFRYQAGALHEIDAGTATALRSSGATNPFRPIYHGRDVPDGGRDGTGPRNRPRGGSWLEGLIENGGIRVGGATLTPGSFNPNLPPPSSSSNGLPGYLPGSSNPTDPSWTPPSGGIFAVFNF